jgi:hypothetical protein
MGFFAWLREGVRRAVLLGFSDAIDQIGNRAQSDDVGPQLAAALRQGIIGDAQPALPAVTAPTGRRRLGKSLQQIREGAQT